MFSKELFKEVIVTNEDFIRKEVRDIIKRQDIVIPESLKKVVVLYGIRRSGKTFILYDLFKRYGDRALYIDFEDERLAGFQQQDFERLKEAFWELKPEPAGRDPVFLLDEIQNVPGWEKFCRRVVERGNIKVYVSGSSSGIMPAEIHTALRGRSWSVEVFPFSFREALQVRGVDPGDGRLFYGAGRAKARRTFAEYLRWGGFPEVFPLRSELEKRKLLREYLDAMFFRDLVERYGITNIPLLDALTDKLFSSFSTKFSLTAFYKQYRQKFPFSKDLLYRYYKHFLQSMLIGEVRKFSESSYKRMRNPAKVYLVDTGLCRKTKSEDAGRVLENAVFLELKRRGYEVFYFHEQGECDFVFKT